MLTEVLQSSILVDADGVPKIGDPGLMDVEDSSPILRSGGESGSVRWMAPELLQDSEPDATFSSDVYAFGMTCLVRQRVTLS